MNARWFAPLSLLVACAARPARIERPRAERDVVSTLRLASAPVADGAVPDAVSSESVAPVALRDAVPSILVEADPAARWAVLCQSREDTDHDGHLDSWTVGFDGTVEGDTPQPFVFSADGSGHSIDDFVASSSTGDHLVFVRAGRLVLRDVRSSRESELRADITADNSPVEPHGAAVFSPDGAKMLYVRSRGAPGALVLRSMADGDERELSAGEGAFVRARLLSSHWGAITVVSRDRDGSGAIELPGAHIQVAPRRCRPREFVSYQPRVAEDAVVTRLFSTTSLRFVDAERALLTMGDRLIAMKAGALWEYRDGAQPRELAPASCSPRVIGHDPETRRLMVYCARERGRVVRPEIITDDGRQPLSMRIVRPDDRALLQGRVVRVSVLTSASAQRVEASLYDLRSDRRWSEPAGVVHTSFGSRTLVERDDQFFIVDEEQRTTRLPIATVDDHAPLRYGRFVVAERALIDVGEARVVGEANQPIVFVADSGRALVATRENHSVFYGPLRWATLPPYSARPR